MDLRLGISTKQPTVLWFLAVAFALLSFGFGVVNSLFVLYATIVLDFTPTQAYTLYGAFASFIYILPLYGGKIADWFGYQKGFVLGVLLELLAIYLISIPSKEAVFLGLALLVTGTAVNVPSFLVLLGKMYKKEDIRRQSGFTIYYMIMNLGYLIAMVAGGYEMKLLNFQDAFLIADLIAATSLIIFFIGIKFTTPDPSRDITPKFQWHPLWQITGLVLMTLLPFPVIFGLLKVASLSNELVLIVGILVIIGIYILAFYQKTKEARYKLVAFSTLCVISIGFWSLYMLEPSLLTIFVENNVNRSLFGQTIPTPIFYALDPLFIILIGVLFSVLWLYLRKRNKDPSLPTKFSLSLFVMSSGFFLLVLAIALTSGKLNMGWIVAAYVFFAAAELLISPIGMSMVGQLSPEGMEGFLMGVWQVFSGVSAAISAYLAKMATTPSAGSVAVTNPIYSMAFIKIGAFSLGLGIISTFFIPFIKKRISSEYKSRDSHPVR